MEIEISEYNSSKGKPLIRISFSRRPHKAIRQRLINSGFRWNWTEGGWDAEASAETKSTAESIKAELLGNEAAGVIIPSPVREIKITSAPRTELQPGDVNRWFDTWKDADKFISTLIGEHSIAYYDITWDDGKFITGKISLEPPSAFDRKRKILSEYVLNFWTEVSKGDHRPVYGDKEIAFAKELIKGYLFKDIPEEKTGGELTNLPSETSSTTRKQTSSDAQTNTIAPSSESSNTTGSKVPVKIIEITTALHASNPDFDKSAAFNTWKDANIFVGSLIGKHSNAYYNIMWQDGQTISGAMDLEPADFFEGKKNVLSEDIKRYYTHASKAVNDPIFDSRAVAFAKMILNGYLFEDIPETEAITQETPAREVSASEAEEKQEEEKSEAADTKENNDHILREFYRYVVSHSKLKDPQKVSDDVLKQWLSEHYPSFTGEKLSAMIKLHHLALIGMKKGWIRKTGEPIKRPYSTIYDKLHKVIPDLEKHLEAGVENGKSKSGGFMDLNFDYIGKDKYGHVFALSHYYKQEGDMIADPDMQIRLIPEMKMAEALTYQDTYGYKEVYSTDEEGKEFVRPALKKYLNSFLNNVWLKNLIDQGHRINLNQQPVEENRIFDYDIEEPEENKRIVFNPVAMARYAKDDPYYQHIWKNKYDLNFLKGNKFTLLQLSDLSAQLNSEIVDNALAEEKYQEVYDELEDKTYTVIKAKGTEVETVNLAYLGKFVGPFKLMQSWTYFHAAVLKALAQFIEGRPDKLILTPYTGSKEDSFTPVAEVTISTVDKQHQVVFRLFPDHSLVIYSINGSIGGANQHEKNNDTLLYLINNPEKLMVDVAHMNALRSLTGQPAITAEEVEQSSDGAKPIIKDMVCRDTEIPNVMIPAGVREPFASHDFYHKPMQDLVREKFSDLAPVTGENLSNASAIQLYELIQLGHPDEYPPITLSRFDLLHEWERRGEEMFQQLGLPTDLNYPYVNIHVGYRSVDALGAVIDQSKNDKDKWWSAASDYRPVGDLSKAIDIINDTILELKQKKAALINEKTGKPKGKNTEEARNIDFHINSYERSKEVVEGYLDGYSQEQMRSVPEDIRSALWNQSDDEYPVNKVTIKGIEFNQAWLRVALSQKIKSLSISEAKEIAGKLSTRFKERRPLDGYGKGLVTIGKKGDKREAEIIWSYIDDIIIDHDLNQKDKRQGAMQYLLELLYPDYFGEGNTKGTSKELSQPKNQHELNQAIERFIDEKDSEGDGYNENDKNYIRQYTGSGGLHQQGASGEGILYEFYTPDELVQRMWGLAELYGFNGGNIFEPACGTGRFLKYVPVESHAIGFEVNHYAKRIAEILYPWAEVVEMPFESIFFAGNVHLKDNHKWKNHFDLIIGNPPYGPFSGKYAGMGEKKWTGAIQYDQYFMLRCLDLLKPGGLLVFLIPSAFLDNDDKYVEVQKKIDEKAEIVDAYRLPNKIFPNTDWGTDIIVLRKK